MDSRALERLLDHEDRYCAVCKQGIDPPGRMTRVLIKDMKGDDIYNMIESARLQVTTSRSWALSGVRWQRRSGSPSQARNPPTQAPELGAQRFGTDMVLSDFKTTPRDSPDRLPGTGDRVVVLTEEAKELLPVVVLGGGLQAVVEGMHRDLLLHIYGVQAVGTLAVHAFLFPTF